MTVVPRLVIAAPAAGSGKTAVATGLLSALAARGLKPSAFTIGPDHVGPAYHALAGRCIGHNLDLTLVGQQRISALFAAGSIGSDVAIIEGVAGLFDDAGSRATTNRVAALLRAPVILVINAAGQGRSAAAVIHGIRSFDPSLWLAGVVFTGVSSSSHASSLHEAVDEIGVPVLGMMYREKLAPLPSHWRGIVPAGHRDPEAVAVIERYAAAVEADFDLERILAVARSAPKLDTLAWSARNEIGNHSHAGIGTSSAHPMVGLLTAGDIAFGYAEVGELLTAAGARVKLVDPWRDETLPAEMSALMIGGGLPERYAEDLSANRGLRQAVGDLARRGAPIIAEGGGVWWLSHRFDTYDMCGVLNARAAQSKQAFGGYRTAIAISDNAAGPVGTRVTGHVLRKWEPEPRAGLLPAWRWPGRPAEGFVQGNIYASFLELHWTNLPQRVRAFVARAAVIASKGARAA